MQCAHCPVSRSKVIVDFVAGHAVCQACGVVLRALVFEEAGGDEVKTRHMMARLQPAAAVLSSSPRGGMGGMGGMGGVAFVKHAYRTKASPMTSTRRSKKMTMMKSALRDYHSSSSRLRGVVLEQVQDTCDRARVGSRTNLRAQSIIEQYLGCAVPGSRPLSKRNVVVHAVVCVYIACREHKCARTVTEVCRAMDVKEQEFKKIYKLVVKTLQLRVRASSPVEFLGRFSQLLQWHKYSIETAAQQLILQTPPDGSIAPAAVAAAALYLAATGPEQGMGTGTGMGMGTDGRDGRDGRGRDGRGGRDGRDGRGGKGDAMGGKGGGKDDRSGGGEKIKGHLPKPKGLFKRKRKRARLAAKKAAAAATANKSNIGSLGTIAETLNVSVTHVQKAYAYMCRFEMQRRSNTPPVLATKASSTRPPTPATV
jgi:transcription initiation factor TFIIIB Brf1 subunit/transcription initiation factor TFIIB